MLGPQAATGACGRAPSRYRFTSIYGYDYRVARGGTLAPPIDGLAIPADSRAKRMGALHGIGNAVVVALFAGSWLIRAAAQQWQPGMWALVCSFAGVLLAAVTGWLGGELMERLGMGVDEGAGINAPSSLSRTPSRTRPAGPAPARCRVSRHGAHRPQ